MQLAILAEGKVAPDAVDRDAEQRGVVTLKLRQDLVVERHLIAAHRAPVRRIEGENHRAAAKLLEPDLLVRRRRQGELGRTCSRGQCHGLVIEQRAESVPTLGVSRENPAVPLATMLATVF